MNLFGSCSKGISYFGIEEGEYRYLHNLKRGDHVVRWTRIVVYPIQVHGIVLSASDDVVTIVDFGLSASSSSSSSSKEEGNKKIGKNSAMDKNKKNENSNNTALEEMITHEDRAMIKSCEEHRSEIMGPDRMNILVLTEEKDIKQWKKVEYDSGNESMSLHEHDGDIENKIEEKNTNEHLNRRNNWFWNMNNENRDEKGKISEEKEHHSIEKGDTSTNNETCLEEQQQEQQHYDDYVHSKKNKMEENSETITCVGETRSTKNDDENKNQKETQYINQIQETGEQTVEDEHDNKDGNNNEEKSPFIVEEIQRNTNQSSAEEIKTDQCEHEKEETKKISKINHENKKTSSPHKKSKTSSSSILSSRSDPINIVLARVRFLVSNPHILPPHNIFYSNSECIAVWCKTGTWSTFQASFYLHSTAAGNLKTAVTAAAAVSGSTVTTTVPASGMAGWFGMTTTTTVSLVSVQPWLIPALAGYGIVAVGTPYLFLRKCHERWKTTTTVLNDKFWSELDADVYVDAIKNWSGLA